jgi:hypothetical protein
MKLLRFRVESAIERGEESKRRTEEKRAERKAQALFEDRVPPPKERTKERVTDIEALRKQWRIEAYQAYKDGVERKYGHLLPEGKFVAQPLDWGVLRSFVLTCAHNSGPVMARAIELYEVYALQLRAQFPMGLPRLPVLVRERTTLLQDFLDKTNPAERFTKMLSQQADAQVPAGKKHLKEREFDSGKFNMDDF